MERRHYGPPRWWDQPPYPDIMDYTAAGLTTLVGEAQNEVSAAALPYQEQAAAKMKARIARFDVNLRNLTPAQREEVLGALRALTDKYDS